jgi:hypothetical protein
MKRTLIALAAGTLMSVGGLANAAEQLSDNQMDQVAAGTYTPFSLATTSGFALIGTVASGAETSAYSRTTWYSKTMKTTASAATISTGVFVKSTASAGSGFN